MDLPALEYDLIIIYDMLICTSAAEGVSLAPGSNAEG
jgi:hypothetical protein